MADSQTKLIVELEVILRDIRRKMRELDQFKRKLESVANVRVGQRTSTASIDRQTLAAQRLALQQQRLELQQRRLAVQQQQVTNAQNRATQAAQRLTTANERLNRTVGGQGRVLQQAQRQLNSLGAAALRVGGGLRSVGASAAILVTGPLVALGTIAGRAAADIDAIRNRLIATEGSLEAANTRLEQLRRLADESVGVTRRTALDTFAILATLGDVTEDTINRQIRAFGRLNAAFTIEDQQTFFRNLVQIFQQGFEIRDIREALGRVPIFNTLLEQAFGTADPERLRELKAQGKLTLDTFLAGLATAVETDPVLGRIQESIRVRFQKTFERLTDSLEPLGRAILGPLERIVTAIEPIILRVAAAFGRLPEGVQTAIVVVGLLVAAAGPLLFILGGIASGIGAIATILATTLGVLGLIGLPALLAILAGGLILIGEWVLIVTVLGAAWRTNFLNIRKLTAGAANAVIAAFNRIRAIVNEVVQRVLPTLRSITQKVIGGATQVWEIYGATVVAVIRDSFAFVTGVIETFTRIFGNFIDLVLKLVDGDWRGVWRAFARIIVSAMDSVVPLLGTLNRAVTRAFGALLAFIIRQAVRFAIAAQQLALSFISSLVGQLILGGPQIGNAILLMFLAGIAGLTFTGIASLLVKNFIAAIRRAAAEGQLELTPSGPQVGVDVGSFNRRRQRRGTITETDTDTKGQNRLRRELDRLREAQDRLDETREQGSLDRLRSQIETGFNATKNGLDRELTVLEQNFDDRLVALRKYLKERRSLEEAQVDAEIQKELELSSVLFSELSARRRAAEKEFQTELREIADDPKLKGQARAVAIQTAELRKAVELEKAHTEFRIKFAESTAEVAELEKKRKQAGEDLVRFERLITEELAKQQDQLRFDLLEQQGRTADAEAGRLRARFRETLRDLRIDVSGLGADLQTAIADVDLAQLQARLDELPEPVRVLVDLLNISIKRAEIAELAQLVDNLSAGLRLDEQRIQNKVLDGLISQREAQAQIVVLQQKYRATLLDILAGELAKAESLGEQADNQAQILAIQAQIAEVKRLGVAIDEAGQRINQALFQDLQSGLSGIFSGARRGFEGLRDAAVSFGERLLDTLNDIAATSILERIEGLFKPDATNTEGTIGGFFSKLFGLQPKQADATVAATTLQTGASTAAATLTTGVATAGASFTSLVATAGASFASIVVAAASGVAAALGAGAIAGGGAGSGLAGLLGGAATGMFPAVPGGVYKFVEGGHPEAVLTTDPRHAARQVAILRAFLRETKGLGGRIKSFAAGAFVSPYEAQSMLLSGLSAGPAVSNSSIGELAIAGTSSMMKLRQVLVDQRSYRDWLTSSEGEQVIVDLLYRNQPVIRKLGGGK